MAASDPKRRFRVSSAARICVGYVIFAGLWIYVSDSLIRQLPPVLVLGFDLQTIKGWVFVVGSAGLLYLLLKERANRRRDGPVIETPRGNSDDRDRQPALWRHAFTPLLIFVLLASAIALTGYLLYRHETDALQGDTDAELKGAVQRKTDEIAGWVEQNRKTLELIARGSFFAREVVSWIESGPETDEAKGTLLETRLEAARQALGLGAISLFDPHGRPLLLSGPHTGDHPEERELATRALRTGRLIVSDLHRVVGPQGTMIAVDMAAPVTRSADRESDGSLGGLGSGSGPDATATLLFRIDAARTLFPMLLRWPSPSTTGEFLLVRHDGNDILYMNELRNQPGMAMRLRMPLQRDSLSAAVLQNTSSIVSATDYRGVEVLSASRPVPGTNWRLIAKVDTAEVYGPIRRVSVLIGVVVGLFITSAGIGVLLWWRQQQALFLAQQLRDRMEREALIRQFEFLSQYANDIILMIDERGRVVEANARAEREYGYPRDQLLGMDIGVVEEARGTDIDLLHTGDQTDDGVIYDTWHRRNDGSRFPVEVSSRLIEFDGRQLRHDIIRDITERVAAETKTRDLLDQLRRISTANILGEMVSVLTHELKQPLTAALNYINASRRWSGDDAGRAGHHEAMMGKAAEQIRRADQFVRKLREFMQKRDAEFTDVPIVPLIKQTIDLALLDGVRIGVASRFEHDPDLPLVHIDVVQIQQVLINLLRNAVEAMEDVDAPFIIVKARIVSGDQIEVSVKDNGPGLSSEVAAEIFQPFVSTKPGGIGMGLSVCSGIIQAHGGRLWWEIDAASGWTAFRFTLPASRFAGPDPGDHLQ